MSNSMRGLFVALGTAALGCIALNLAFGLLGVDGTVQIVAGLAWGGYCGLVNPLYPYIVKENA